MRRVIQAHALTGHNEWWLRCIVIVCSWSSFFWDINVMLMEDASRRRRLFWIRLSFLLLVKKLISLSRRSLVFLSPWTWLYSHERIPKNRAPTANSPIALSCSQIVFFHRCLKTIRGIHCWCWVAPSSFLYPRSWRWSWSDRLPEASKDGSFRKFDL